MGSFLCKQRRRPAPAQRRRKLLRAPCMLCFIVREPAVSEPPAAPDRANPLLLSPRQEPDIDMKRKSSGEKQQPGTPCKLPRCSEDQEPPAAPCKLPQCSDNEPPAAPCKLPQCSDNEPPATPCKLPKCSDNQEPPAAPCKLTQCSDNNEPPTAPCNLPQCSDNQEPPAAPYKLPHCSDNQEPPATPCKLPRCSEDQEPPATPCKLPQCSEDQEHPATPCKLPRFSADQEDLPCMEEPAPACPAKDELCPPEESSLPGTHRHPTTCRGYSSPPSQDQPQTLREADPDPHKVEEEPLNINQLPPSLLLKIFSHLSLNERCLCVSLVCKYWRDLCLDFQFWKQLDISSRCQVKDHILESIASRFWNITELNISDCLNVTDAGVGMVAARCSGLVKYTAYRCKQLSDSSLISLVTHCTSLQKVHVGNQDRLTDEAIKQLGSRCKDLKDIHFGQCYKISDEGMIIIAKGCPKLKKIYMQENKLVSDKSVEAFAEHCPELEYVGFMGCSVTSRGVICLTNLKNLSSLDLRHISELDNETVMEIVKKCRNLTSLNLCLNRNIDDRCVEVIAKEGRSLKELYLVTCKITDHALIAIGRYSTTIETVDVGWCKEITDQGATLIAQSSKSIRYLGLMRCDQVNEVTVEQLVQQYPHITFSTVLQDCKRTLERAYQMGWTPNASSVS